MAKKLLLFFIYCFFINGLIAQPNLEWYGNYSRPILRETHGSLTITIICILLELLKKDLISI